MSNPDKPKRQNGWSIPDAPVEIRRLAVAEAKRRGLTLHEFISRAVLLALDHGGVLNDKYDKKALDDLSDLNDKHDKYDKYDEVLVRLGKIETILNLSQPSPAETEASPPPVKPKRRRRVKPQNPPESALNEA